MSNRIIDAGKLIIKQVAFSLKKVPRSLIAILSIAISVVILGLLVYRQRDVLVNHTWQFRPVPIILSFVIFSAALFWAAMIWGWIMNSLGMRLSYKKHVQYYILSNLAKRIPGTIWYVAGRFQLYAAEGISAKTTAVASGIEMVLITLAGILVVLVSSTKTILQYHISPFLLVGIFAIGVAIMHPKVIRWLIRRRNLEVGEFDYVFTIKGILAYIVSWILGGVILFEIGNIISPISASNLINFIGSWTLVGVISTVLFFSPSNFGITEIGLSLLLSSVIPSSIAVIIAISARVLMILFEMLWTGVFLLIKAPRRNALTQKD